MNRSNSIIPDITVVQQTESVREIRQLMNSFYQMIDTSIRMFEAQYNDLVAQQNFTKEIAEILSISEDEAHTQIKHITQGGSIFGGLVTATLNQNMNREISGQPIINYQHFRSLINAEKNDQKDLKEKLDNAYNSLHQSLQKGSEAHRGMIISMLATLKEHCMLIIQEGEKRGNGATTNTLKFIEKNNVHEKIVSYGNKIYEYYEQEISEYNLLPSQWTEIFIACMYNTHFYDDLYYKKIIEKYDPKIFDLMNKIVDNRNEYEDIIGSEDGYDDVEGSIGTILYNMTLVSYAIAESILEKVDNLLDSNHVAILAGTTQSVDTKCTTAGELLSIIEEQATAPTEHQLILLRSQIHQSYEMSDYHFTKMTSYLYRKYLHPTKPDLKRNMTEWLYNELKKYGVILSKDSGKDANGEIEF